ncbi:MAG: hypothetical protein M3Z21_07270 [Pseudomonadota bacterium]|nr:hypothetical protein [Pseudomonadota bacterium]
MLRTVFTALETANVAYCLLRGLPQLDDPEPFKEIDLLVLPQHLGGLRRAVAGLGFVELPNWGHSPHHFFIAYDQDGDRWLKLDVVTSLRFGRPWRYIGLVLARRFVEERQAGDGVYCLAPDNELFATLLHGLLDKGRFSEAQGRRLAELAALIDARPLWGRRLTGRLERHLGSDFAWTAVRQRIAADDWQWFLQRREAVRQRLFRLHRLRNGACLAGTWLMWRSRPLLHLLRRRGLTVALLAPDGAGKSTLAQALRDDGFLRARLIYMGTNPRAGGVGLPAGAWLAGRRRQGSVSARLLGFPHRLAQQWLRCAVGLYHKGRGRFVVFDRYVYDGLLAPASRSLGRRLRRGLLLGTCPAPDLVVMLDAPGEVLHRRKGEHSPAVLERQRQIFLSLQDRLAGMVVVDAGLPPPQVRREVLGHIWTCYRQRLGHRQGYNP